MKKYFLAFGIVTLLVSMGCTKQDLSPKEVTVSLNYSFIESGSMTKSSDVVYSDFYEKYVKSKVLTPKTFNLTFINVETKAEAVVNGSWNKNHSLKLPTGEYEVIGTSHPTTKACLDSLFLCFNETVVIGRETTGITLTAQYDSYLLLFDVDDKESVHYGQGYRGSSGKYEKILLKSVDNVYYAFFNELWSGNENNMVVTRVAHTSTVDMNKIPFEKGHYYYFNDLSNSFDIPPMTQN